MHLTRAAAEGCWVLTLTLRMLRLGTAAYLFGKGIRLLDLLAVEGNKMPSAQLYLLTL